MNKIKMLLGIVICHFTGSIWGQAPGSSYQNDITQKIYPKTPSERSFEKFTNIPNANYTGVQGFSIPIHTISGSDFNFPITINYNGGGIKVDEISSNIGLGWSLNLGGISLSQEIRGKMDDQNSNGGVTLDDPENFETEINYPTALSLVGAPTMVFGNCIILNPHQEAIADINPDYFSYSLLNDNGKYILDSQGDFHTIPKDDISLFNGFDMIDNKGIKYDFDRYISSETTTGMQSPFYSYSFYINEILFPQGDKMIFHYIDDNYSYISNYEMTKKVLKRNEALFNSATDDLPNELLMIQSETYTTEKIIESIEYENTVVKFLYKKSGSQFILRDDVHGGKILDKIEVYFKPAQGGMELIKEFQIYTDYFVSNSPTHGLHTETDFPVSQYQKRLKLISIENLLSGEKYAFNYYGERAFQNGSNIDLPSRFSFSTDHWGSFNGKDNDSPIENFIYTSINHENVFRDNAEWGGNKQPDKDFAVIGSLEKVHLPTGGVQLFEYELDEYTNELNELVVENHFFKDEYFLEHTFWRNIDDLEYFEWTTFAELDIENPEGFDFRDGFDYRIDFSATGAPINDGDMPDVDHYQVKLVEDNEEENEIGFFANLGEYLLPKLDVNKNYKFKIKRATAGHNPAFEEANNYIQIGITLTWAQNNPKTFKNKHTGSLRTKSIALYNDATSDVEDFEIKKSYVYQNFSDSTYSGGIYTSESIAPMNSKEPCSEQRTGSSFVDYCNARTYFRSPNYLNLNSIFGKSVFYENVTEVIENNADNNLNHKIEYTFQSPDILSGVQNLNALPKVYRPHNEYTGGFVKSQRIFNDQNVLQKEIKNFNYPLDFHFNSLSSSYNGNLDYAIAFGLNASIMRESPCINDFPEYHLNHNFYYITSAWVKHKKTTEDIYENGQLKMTNTTEYEYSPTYAHLNPVKIINTNSSGETLLTEYQYPQDLAGQRPYMATLVAENRIADPVVTKTYNVSQNKPLSVQETVYEKDGTTGNLLLPKYVFAKKGSETLNYSPTGGDLKITYDRYDARGNLQQYTLADGTPVSIIWGYNGQYPIAKVEGVAYTDIETEANLLAANNNLIESSFNTLRGLVNASTKFGMLTCYIYEPLVGVKMIIQPNGQKEIYEYDSAGRLMKVKDQNGKELKKIDYHYSTQP